jgi:hypothetical protein
MLFARGADGARLRPQRGERASCAQCGGEVLAKCGKYVSWHWAHRVADCDSWSEGETEWHLGWKRAVVDAACEVVIGAHRADIRTQAGLVVELQHSSIDPATIAEREHFYGAMAWLFDARAFELLLYPRGAELSFVWSRPRQSLLAVEKPLHWDLGDGFVLNVTQLSSSSALGGFAGSGVLLDAACWASQLFGADAREAVHVEARARGRRVQRALERGRELLRARPELGLDGATRQALRELSTPQLGT